MNQEQFSEAILPFQRGPYLIKYNNIYDEVYIFY